MEEIALGELLLRIWRSPMLRHIAAGVLLAIALVVAWFVFWGWIAHREHAAAKAATDALQAKIDAATAAESQRRDQQIDQANATRDAALARAAATEKSNVTLASAFKRLSARNDHLPCWDAAASERLRRLIDQGRRQAGDGAAPGGASD
jgi:type VI protein secretion system component VasK